MITPGRGLVSVVTGCVALLTGCAHAGSTDAARSGAADSAQAASDTAEAQRSAFVTACTGTSAGWQATAVVSNRDSIEHRYLVVISFMTPESTDLERTRTEVLVAPGATQDFTTETRLDPVTRPQTVRCVLRGVEQL
ncbi:hypothetical protein ACFOS0_18340 [Nocardia seriolae]|uniref:hypothetical protein n=1 Tax=Nocardia seriolae TaxID=37332 RepID=UPI0011905BA5|nr:hypothetical protein [Nocardia seriolae]GEM27697.1 hypothetical protein NS2_59360 [Nocardia seriolae NBRC 15557]